mgnify:CR=1 FL=1
MAQPGDTFVLILILIIIGYFLLRKWLPMTFTEWLFQSSQPKKENVKGKVPSLLKKNGYEVMNGKQKVPMTITLDDQTYESRLYVDYIAKKEDDWYLVFVERIRKPLKRYGPGLRDMFLTYYLLYKPSGIIYVTKEQQLHVIKFEISAQELQKQTKQYWAYLVFFLLGLIVALLSR